ncbi:hypothetical protein [Actinoplanes sp. NPDC051494]|uniref:hypothetical protein n=1 Tax=Actinoplanes sp. NPDC051494 TaxID=3363907 RepID=UPI0037A7987D
MRRTAMIPVLLMLLSGCDTEDEPVRAGLPPGVVFAREATSDEQTTLVVRDITTGDQVGRAVIPGNDLGVRRSSFDAAMSRYAYVEDCELRVATLTGDIFADSASWTGERCYEGPSFGADGRVRAVDSGPGLSGRIVSVDPAEPATAPRDEGGAPERVEKRSAIDGVDVSEVRVWSTGDEIDGGSAYGVSPGGGEFHYDCPAAIDTDQLLCSAVSDEQAQYYGTVALLTLGPAATMRELAPPGDARSLPLFPAPDGRSVAVQDPAGWYTAALDGSGTSAPRRIAAGTDRPLFWG